MTVRDESWPSARTPGALIGCAGWSIPRANQAEFPDVGSHLERYAKQFAATEINSSFHRVHRASTYLRWRESVPRSFRFSAKFPKTITHAQRLLGAEELVKSFLAEVSPLEEKLGYLLVQLPPSLSFDAGVIDGFFGYLFALVALL